MAKREPITPSWRSVGKALTKSLPAIVGKSTAFATPTYLARRQIDFNSVSKLTSSLPADEVTNSESADERRMRRQTLSSVALQYELKMSFQLARMNYLVNFINFMKNLKVRKGMEESRQLLASMDQKINKQEDEISRLSGKVDGLRAELEEQKALSARLLSALRTEKEMLTQSTVEHQAQIEGQCYLIDQQQALIQKLLDDKLRHDLLIDTSLLMFTIYLSHSVRLKYPMEIFLLLVPENKLHSLIRRCAQLAFVVQMFLLLRRLSLKEGLHNRVGGPRSYIELVLSMLRKSWLWRLWHSHGVT